MSRPWPSVSAPSISCVLCPRQHTVGPRQHANRSAATGSHSAWEPGTHGALPRSLSACKHPKHTPAAPVTRNPPLSPLSPRYLRASPSPSLLPSARHPPVTVTVTVTDRPLGRLTTNWLSVPSLPLPHKPPQSTFPPPPTHHHHHHQPALESIIRDPLGHTLLLCCPQSRRIKAPAFFSFFLSSPLFLFAPPYPPLLPPAFALPVFSSLLLPRRTAFVVIVVSSRPRPVVVSLRRRLVQ